MTATQDDTIAELQRANAELRQELAAHAAALAQRNSEYGERIEQQAATIDVLKAMSASAGDEQPVLDLVTRRARELCDAETVGIFSFDGDMISVRCVDALDPQSLEPYLKTFPRAPSRDYSIGRAILDRRIIEIDDADADPNLAAVVHKHRNRSIITLPFVVDDRVAGGMSIAVRKPGGLTDPQKALARTLAEQVSIAMGAAETYRALQTRTSDLQETLEYQTAISDVLKVISRSTFDLQPVLDTVAETAARLCDADQALIATREGERVRMAANFGFPAEIWALWMARGPRPLVEIAMGVGPKTILEGRIVHIHDVAAAPDYPVENIAIGRQRTTLGVPLVRDGETIGSIVLARQRVEPFTDRQIELVSTFADQAVMAIENTRLITEQREALEQQTAMAEVLAVINAHPGELGPVFDMILKKAHRLCDIGMGALLTCEAGQHRAVVTRGYSPEADAHARRLRPILDNLAALAKSGAVLHDPDVSRVDSPLSDNFGRTFIALTGARTYLVVPLSKEGTLLGTITAVRREVRPFTERQITLLRNFAAQAVIAMENARLINEQREALEHQTATAEVLQVINASPGDLAPVFDAILEKAHHLCGAVHGVLGTYNGDYFRAVASRGLPAAVLERLKHGFHGLENPITRLLFDGARFVQIPDLKEIDHPMPKAVSALGGFRTALFVPLRKDGTLLGHITALRSEVRPFTDKQIALLQNFAAQAVIAMENARLLTEQQEALEQQTATAEVLGVINSSPGNLTPVFEAMLDKAMRLCNAAFGSLYVLDGEHLRSVAQRGVPAYADYRAAFPPSSTGGIVADLIRGRRPIHVLDMKDRERYRAGYPDARAIVDVAGARTTALIPLVKDDTFLGYISIFRQEVQAFSDKQIALLQNFAAQAVIAMENARLINEQQEALEQQTATAEVLQVINSSPGDLAPVFDTMLQKATDLCAAAFGILWTFDGGHYHAVAFRNVPSAYSEFLRDPPPATPLTPLGRIAAGEAFAQIADMADEIFAAGGPMFHRAVELGGFRTIVGVPLRKDGVLLGAITIYRQEVRPFSDKQIALLQNFAAQAVIAMENARLLDEIRQRQEELRVTFENMGDGVAMFDETQNLVAWNRKFQDILDVPDDIIARRQTFSEYVRYLAERGEYDPEADPEDHVRRLIEQAGQSRTYERTRPDGRVIEIRHNPVAGGGFVLIYADITERKRSEAEIRAARDAAEEASRTIEAAYCDLKAAQANLIQAEKMASLGQLTAGIAHEIKNPLNFVNNFSALSTELIDELRDVLAPEPLGESARTEVDDLTLLLKGNLEKVVQHGQRADGIVRSMLDHSRGSSGERRMVDLNALIDEALNLAYHGARAQDQSFNITLERDFGEAIGPIEVNPQDITRVFLNLFANGFYAVTRRAREGGNAAFVPTLKVITRDAGEAVEIRVRDNGTGIPTDIRDKLFQPFFTTKPTGEGTGLGLSITYDIVTQQHGGTIAVDSNVGEYSEFTIQLPRKP